MTRGEVVGVVPDGPAVKVDKFGLLVCAVVGLLFGGAVVAAPDVSLVTIDSVGDTGLDSSLVLDAAGHPVIAYRDVTNGDLRLVHCDDPVCAGVETPVTVDATGQTGHSPSLVLDAVGNPVIAYFENIRGEFSVPLGPLRFVHCDDPMCVGVETPVTLDPTVQLGGSPALALDAAGNPVIARGTRLLHCDDPACAGDETPVVVDPNGGAGGSSMVLDTAGNPVIAYRGGTSGQAELWVTRCADPACAATASSVMLTGGDSGAFSLVLDAADIPVIAYTGFVELILVRCGDPACTGDVARVRVDQRGYSTGLRSLVLDAAGNPVIAYRDLTSGRRDGLVVLHCDDPVCAGEETPVLLDAVAFAGNPPSLVLDPAGRPVISYAGRPGSSRLQRLSADLMVARCDAPRCPDLSGPTATIGLGAGQSATAEAGPVVFEVVFDEPIASFTAADVTVTGTAGATAATVTGDGPGYTVTVDTFPGDGTVIIDIAAGAVTDLAGNASQASVVIASVVTVQAPPAPTTLPELNGNLPETGSDHRLTLIAALFLAAGLGLLAASRRRTV